MFTSFLVDRVFLKGPRMYMTQSEVSRATSDVGGLPAVPSSDDKPKIPTGLLRGLSRETLASGRAADLTYEYLEAGVELIADALDHDQPTVPIRS